jgi:hypothetical protein
MNITQQLRDEVQYETQSIAINEESLRATLRSYLSYYHDSRCHLALAKDSPDTREVQPPERGVVVEISKVGGLHHRYERRAA